MEIQIYIYIYICDTFYVQNEHFSPVHKDASNKRCSQCWGCLLCVWLQDGQRRDRKLKIAPSHLKFTCTGTVSVQTSNHNNCCVPSLKQICNSFQTFYFIQVEILLFRGSDRNLQHWQQIPQFIFPDRGGPKLELLSKSPWLCKLELEYLGKPHKWFWLQDVQNLPGEL